MPIGPGNPHQSALPLLTTNPTTLLLLMSSSTYFNNTSDEENTQQFWMAESSGPSLQSPRWERHPSTCLVLARVDTPTPTGPTCRGNPQTRLPQCRALMNSLRGWKDVTVWNHQKHKHRRDSEDIVFGLLLTQTDILLDAFQPYPSRDTVYSHAQSKYSHQERFSDLYLQDLVQAGKMVWEEKVKKMEMMLFQEEFVRRGLRLVHDAPDQINPADDTYIGYVAVLGAEIFTKMEGMVEEVSHLGFRFKDVH